MRRKTLSANQISWLNQIPEDGISEARLLDLRGRARDWGPRYRQSLTSAIEAHNTGTATNSPLPRTARIEAGAFGPQGGRGYRLVIERDALVEEAIKAAEERPEILS